MRFNRLYLISALISAILPILFCDRTDVVTGAGGSVVSDFNPDLTDLDRGIAAITLLDTAVGAAFSLPAAPDPLFGTFISENMLVGLSDDGDTLAAHVQYSVAGDASYDAEDSLVGAYICFRAAGGDGDTSSGASIALFPSGALPGFTPVNRDDKNAGSVGSFSLSGGDVCSLRFQDDLADSLFRVRASRDTGLYSAFAFSIVDYIGPLIWIEKPYMVVERMRKDCCSDSTWIIQDTIRGAVARYSAFEDPAAAAARAIEPYSSQLTQRTAVYRVNVGKALDSLSRMGFSVGAIEPLNAVITVRYHDPNASDTSSTGEIKLLSRNPDGFKTLVLDTLLTEDIETMSDTGAHLLRYRFAKDGSGSTKLTAPYNTVSFKTALSGVVRRYKPGDPAYVYVYLRAATERSTVWWCKPTVTYPPYPPNIHSVTIETVFTPHGTHRGND